MRTFDTVTDLRNAVGDPLIPNEVVLLKGYNNPRQSGGGNFIWQSSPLPPDDGGVIISNGSLSGVWKRINFGWVNVKFFGAFGLGNSAHDDTDAIQNAIDYVDGNSMAGGIVYIPKGTYYLSSLTLKTGVSIYGEYVGTILRPISDNGDSFIKLNLGPVQNVHIKNLLFVGREYNMNCFYLEAKGDPNSLADPKVGGIWESSFENIRILNFKKNCFTFIGGGLNQLNTGPYDYLRPNQFISMNNVTAVRHPGLANRALLLRGQNGQFIFKNCSLTSPEPSPEWNVELEGVLPKPATPGNSKINGTYPSIINFYSCTMQDAIGAIRMNAVLNVQLNGCWFENLNTGILVENESRGVSVSNCRFSNVSESKSAGGGSGYVMFTTTSGAVFRENVLVGDYKGITSTSGNGGTTPVGTVNILFFSQNNLRKDSAGSNIIF